MAQHQQDALDNSDVHKYYGDREVYVQKGTEQNIFHFAADNNKRFDAEQDDESKGSDDPRFKMSEGSFTPKKENVLIGLVAVLIFSVAQGFCDVGRRIAIEK